MRDLQNPSWFPASRGNHEGFCKCLTEDIYHDQTRIAEYEVKTFQAQLDFGIQLQRFAELRIGPMWGSGKAGVETGTTDLPELDEDYAGIKASLIVDRQDRTFFEGYYIETSADFAREARGRGPRL